MKRKDNELRASGVDTNFATECRTSNAVLFKLISPAWAVGPGRCEELATDPSKWNTLQLEDLECVFNRAYNAAILSVGAVFIIWMIISGIKYMSAGGDEKAVGAARRSLTFAVLGFILVLAAYTIIRLVGTLLGASFEMPVFTIPEPSSP